MWSLILAYNLFCEPPPQGGIIGVKSDNMTCVCSRRNCHCSHAVFSGAGDLEDLDYGDMGHLQGQAEVRVMIKLLIFHPVFQECGIGCYSIVALCLICLALGLTVTIIFLFRRIRGNQRKFRVTLQCYPYSRTHLSSVQSQDYHSSLHQTSSISTINTNCTSNNTNNRSVCKIGLMYICTMQCIVWGHCQNEYFWSNWM